MQPQVRVPLKIKNNFVLIYLFVVPDPYVVSVGKQRDIFKKYCEFFQMKVHNDRFSKVQTS